MSQTLILQSPHLANARLPISRHYFDLPDTLPDNILRLNVHDGYPPLPPPNFRTTKLTTR